MDLETIEKLENLRNIERGVKNDARESVEPVRPETDLEKYFDSLGGKIIKLAKAQKNLPEAVSYVATEYRAEIPLGVNKLKIILSARETRSETEARAQPIGSIKAEWIYDDDNSNEPPLDSKSLNRKRVKGDLGLSKLRDLEETITVSEKILDLINSK